VLTGNGAERFTSVSRLYVAEDVRRLRAALRPERRRDRSKMRDRTGRACPVSVATTGQGCVPSAGNRMEMDGFYV